jgi:hypothetical protein
MQHQRHPQPSLYARAKDSLLWKFQEERHILFCAGTSVTQASVLVRDHVSLLEPASLGATPHANAN